MNAQDSHAQVTSARDLEFAVYEHETAELAELDLALLRLDAGTYGVCVDCAAHIPEARLQAKPEVQRCLPYQEKKGTQPSLRRDGVTRCQAVSRRTSGLFASQASKHSVTPPAKR